jgi:hypothetical protein
LHKEYRVVVVDGMGQERPVGNPPYLKEDTGIRVRTLWTNLLKKRGVRSSKVYLQVTDVHWRDL